MTPLWLLFLSTIGFSTANYNILQGVHLPTIQHSIFRHFCQRRYGWFWIINSACLEEHAGRCPSLLNRGVLFSPMLECYSDLTCPTWYKCCPHPFFSHNLCIHVVQPVHKTEPSDATLAPTTPRPNLTIWYTQSKSGVTSTTSSTSTTPALVTTNVSILRTTGAGPGPDLTSTSTTSQATPSLTNATVPKTSSTSVAPQTTSGLTESTIISTSSKTTTLNSSTVFTSTSQTAAPTATTTVATTESSVTSRDREAMTTNGLSVKPTSVKIAATIPPEDFDNSIGSGDAVNGSGWSGIDDEDYDNL